MGLAISRWIIGQNNPKHNPAAKEIQHSSVEITELVNDDSDLSQDIQHKTITEENFDIDDCFWNQNKFYKYYNFTVVDPYLPDDDTGSTASTNSVNSSTNSTASSLTDGDLAKNSDRRLRKQHLFFRIWGKYTREGVARIKICPKHELKYLGMGDHDIVHYGCLACGELRKH